MRQYLPHVGQYTATYTSHPVCLTPSDVPEVVLAVEASLPAPCTGLHRKHVPCLDVVNLTAQEHDAADLRQDKRRL
jgi:hypothetical protein